MSQNKGTLITAPIRPNDTMDPIASAFSNELKGGHHSYATLAERDSIILARRDWGMLCTVYDDGVNNGVYKLEYNFFSTTLSDNANWTLFSSGGSSDGEWLSSVLSVQSSPPTSNDGDRYLVSTSGAGAFAGQNNNIAVYDSVYGGGGGWIFYGPTFGTSLRVDDEKNVIYKWGSNGWRKDVVNQIRYISATSSDGLSYTASTAGQEVIDVFSYSIFYTSFNVQNTGTLSLNIDSVSTLEVKKIIGTSFQSLQSGDVTPGIQYQLVYNSGFFQTVLPQSNVTTIGAAEDGNYTDGLYTDFTTSTPIGTPIDRFNELLKLIVPPNAPTMSSWSATGSFVNGGLSFDGSTSGSFSSATQSPYGAVGIKGTFSRTDSPYRLGIMSRVSQPRTGNLYYQDITGVFNIDVTQSTQTHFPAWVSYSFGYATSGTISFYLNGLTVSSTGLTNSGVIDLTSSGATSGIYLSSATSSKFPFGYNFETNQNRTGSYIIKRDNSSILNGYNWVTVKHEVDGQTYELSRYEWVADGSTQSITFPTPAIITSIAPSTKYISGIQFHQSPYQLVYRWSNVPNLYSNTFYIGNDAIQYRDVSDLVVVSNGVVNSTNTNYPIAVGSLTFSQLDLSGVISPTTNRNISMTFSIQPNIRRINDTMSLSLVIKKTVQGTFSGGTATLSNFFIDTYPSSSTDNVENFDDEDYRLYNGLDKYSTLHLTSNISTSIWNPTLLLSVAGSAQNGLQVINGQLIYPKFDFSSVGNNTYNPNFGISVTNYSNCQFLIGGHGTQSGVFSNFRTYTRYFYFDITQSYSRFVLGLSWSGSSFTTPTTSLLSSATDLWVEFKLPYSTGTPVGGTVSSGSVTGWLDATTPHVPGNYDNGDGCFDGTLSDNTWNTVSGSNWGINFGVKGTYWSGGYVLMRITSGPAWTGFIDRIELNPVL